MVEAELDDVPFAPMENFAMVTPGEHCVPL